MGRRQIDMSHGQPWILMYDFIHTIIKINKNKRINDACTAYKGVTRLDGARGKKQICRPYIRACGLFEANVLYP